MVDTFGERHDAELPPFGQSATQLVDVNFNAWLEPASPLETRRTHHAFFGIRSSDRRPVGKPTNMPSRRAQRHMRQLSTRPGWGPERIEAWFSFRGRTEASYPVDTIRWVLQQPRPATQRRARHV